MVPVGRDQENRGRLRRKIFVLARRYATLDKIKTDHRSQHKSTASQLLDREPFVKDEGGEHSGNTRFLATERRLQADRQHVGIQIGLRYLADMSADQALDIED